MNRVRSMVVLAGLLATAGVAKAQDYKQKYVGKSGCAPGLQPDFSLRLDKAQQTTLLYQDFSTIKIPFIVQATGDVNHCGVIRDLVQIARVPKGFEFRCFDPQAPTDVIIGTAIRNRSTKLVTALDAWRIDLKQQKFIETGHTVICSADGWAGEDDGSDMVDEAKKYAVHHKPGQFASEPAALPKGIPVTWLTEVTMEGKAVDGIQPKYPEEFVKNRVAGTVACGRSGVGSEMKHDASGPAGLILRGSVQLSVEIVHLNQPELHERDEFDVEARADRRAERSIGTGAKGPWADGSRLHTSDGNCVLRFFGDTKEGVHKG